MSWELICLKPQPQRSGDNEVYVFMHKSQRRSKKSDVNALQFSVHLAPLPIVCTGPDSNKLVRMEEAAFHAVADFDKRVVLFDIGKADSALPSLLRGGGAGSLAISELIIWAQKHYPNFSVAANKISPVLLNYPNAETNAIKCLQNFGFSVAKSAGGLQFKGTEVQALQIHINKAKLEAANPPALYSETMENSGKLAAQLQEAQQDLTAAKELLHQSTQAQPSSTPFYTGLAAGLVAGAVLASIIFNL